MNKNILSLGLLLSMVSGFAFGMDKSVSQTEVEEVIVLSTDYGVFKNEISKKAAKINLMEYLKSDSAANDLKIKKAENNSLTLAINVKKQNIKDSFTTSLGGVKANKLVSGFVVKDHKILSTLHNELLSAYQAEEQKAYSFRRSLYYGTGSIASFFALCFTSSIFEKFGFNKQFKNPLAGLFATTGFGLGLKSLQDVFTGFKINQVLKAEAQSNKDLEEGTVTEQVNLQTEINELAQGIALGKAKKEKVEQFNKIYQIVKAADANQDKEIKEN